MLCSCAGKKSPKNKGHVISLHMYLNNLNFLFLLVISCLCLNRTWCLEVFSYTGTIFMPLESLVCMGFFEGWLRRMHLVIFIVSDGISS